MQDGDQALKFNIPLNAYLIYSYPVLYMNYMPSVVHAITYEYYIPPVLHLQTHHEVIVIFRHP